MRRSMADTSYVRNTAVVMNVGLGAMSAEVTSVNVSAESVICKVWCTSLKLETTRCGKAE